MYIDLKNLVSISEENQQDDTEADNEMLEDVATRLLEKHKKAFEELAK